MFECCLLCLYFLSIFCMYIVASVSLLSAHFSYMDFLWCYLDMAWPAASQASRYASFVETNKPRNDFRNKIPNTQSPCISDLHTSNRSEISPGTDLSASQSSSSQDRRWLMSAEYSQKVYLNSFLLRHTKYKVLLEFLDGKKYAQGEQLF